MGGWRPIDLSRIYVPCLFDENCNISATAESWPTELFIQFCFVSALKHTVFDQCSNARIDLNTVAALMGMLLST